MQLCSWCMTNNCHKKYLLETLVMQDLVVHEDAPQLAEAGSTDAVNQIAVLPTLTEAAKLALVTHTISAYALALPKSHAQKLAGRLAADTTRWLSHIFRFVDCASSFHEDHLEGLVRVTRLALHRKYPRYMEEGFTALASQPPLIYSSVAAPLGVVQHLCRQVIFLDSFSRVNFCKIFIHFAKLWMCNKAQIKDNWCE